ncbi:MAG: VWA domain-containing protein [Methanomicrobiaceae archaeon]|uniref:VWA domain-containing protein n=1 Tax=Methanoculleus sp. TaxID=90427 RepID=UPI00320DC678|nr:VWA domain-containing protein [Methanomicrobiaceae archaeon]
MNFQKLIILTILLGLIVPAVGAAGSGRIILSGGADWLVANGTDSAEIAVQVLDEGGAPLANRTVALDVDLAFGRLAPATVSTGASRTAVATFTANRTSGVAVITARAGAAEKKFEQKIDHDLPGRISYLHYDGEVTAGDSTTIVAQFADRHGNPVDDRRVAETVRFSVGSVGDDAAFIGDGGVPVRELEMMVNATGFVRADLATGRTAGENIVRMTVLPGGFERYASVRGLPTGLPAGIDISVSPDAEPFPYQPANGENTFTLTYRLFDAWGNPAAGRDIRIATSLPGEGAVLTTNGTGVACLTYGPKDSTGRITITATAVDNASVTASKVVEFIHTDPVNMLLSASPQSMPSRDVKDDIVSELRAKVMDIKGNPVAGQTVTFTIDTGSIDLGGSTPTGAPHLEKEGQNVAEATTGEDGYAIVRFSPGSFARPKTGEQVAAKGTATVRAAWGDVSRDILLTWVNYPYLSVETSVSNQTVAVNNTTDVTIRLKGDGYAMQPDPIDVVLVMDRSGSMKWDIAQNSGTSDERMKAAKKAGSTFIGQMNPDNDRVGLVSFSNSTRVDKTLGAPFNEVNKTLNALTTSGATQLRRAIYEAILMQKNQGQSGAVKAVVIMTDGDWNYDGSPIGHGTGYPENTSWAYTFSGSKLEPDNYRYYDGLGGTLKKKRGETYLKCTDGEFTNQNMSRFASVNGVKLYTITFAYKPSPTVNETMRILATSTGGFYEHAGSGEELTEIYKRIAGELKTEAGVDTRVALDFGTTRVNDEDRAGGGVFAYIHKANISTTIESWIDNETGPHEITPFHTINQTDDWNDDHTLSFEVGTVHLDQVWEATFRLKVLTDGNINVFGPASKIRFNDGTAALDLPDTFITAVPDLTNTGLGSEMLTLSNPRYTCTEPALEFLTAAWDLSYTGAGTVTEIVEYSNDGGLSWVRFDTLTAGSTATGGVATLDLRDLPPGEYQVRVRASADDAPDAGTLFPSIQVGERQKAYIRLA